MINISYADPKGNSTYSELELSSPHFAALERQRQKVRDLADGDDGKVAILEAEAICPLAQAHDRWLERKAVEREKARRQSRRAMAPRNKPTRHRADQVKTPSLPKLRPIPKRANRRR